MENKQKISACPTLIGKFYGKINYINGKGYKIMDRKYILNDGRKLYYSNRYNKFWLGENPKWKEEYYNESMYSLRLEISHKCNGYCKYCIVFGNNIEKFEKMNIVDVWDWLEHTAWFNKITDIFLIGGEPLLFFNEIKFIRSRFSGDISLSTNGTLINDEMAHYFADNNIFIYISLDGIDEYQNKNRIYRDGSPMYRDILKGLDLLQKYSVRKGLFMVSTPENINDIEITLEKLSNQYSFEKIGYSIPHWTQNEGRIVTPEEYRDALIKIFKNRNKINARVMQLGWRINPLTEGMIKRFSCALHTIQTTVLPDKSIVRCSKIDNDQVLSKTTNEDLDKGCPISCSNQSDSPCADCVALASCGGGCPYDGLRRFGITIDKRECVITPAIVELAIREVIREINMRDDIKSGLVPQDIIMKAVWGD